MRVSLSCPVTLSTSVRSSSPFMSPAVQAAGSAPSFDYWHEVRQHFSFMQCAAEILIAVCSSRKGCPGGGAETLAISVSEVRDDTARCDTHYL